MGYTANLGGQIRHTEIRTGLAPAAGDQEIREESRPGAPRKGGEKAGAKDDD
jgi:hypothetical protein